MLGWLSGKARVAEFDQIFEKEVSFLQFSRRSGSRIRWLFGIGILLILGGTLLSLSTPAHPEIQQLLDRCVAPQGVKSLESLTNGQDQGIYQPLVDKGVDRCRAAAYEFDRLEHSASAFDLSELIANAILALGLAIIVATIISITIEERNRQELEHVLASKTRELSVSVMRGMFNRNHPDSLLDVIFQNILSRDLIRDKLSVAYVFKRWTPADGIHPARLKGKRFLAVKATLTTKVRNVAVNRINEGKIAEVPLCIVLPNPMLNELKEGVRIEGLKINDVAVDNEKIVEINCSVQNQLSDDLNRQARADFGVHRLQAGQSLKIEMVYTMIKELEDSELLQTLQISRNLDVTVFDSTGWDLNIRAKSVGFGTLSEISSDETTCRWTIDDLLLPHQGVLIWWKEKTAPLVQSEDPG